MGFLATIARRSKVGEVTSLASLGGEKGQDLGN